MKDGFYFSYETDITATLQRRNAYEKQDMVKKPLEKLACDSRYFWNRNIMQGFQENNVSFAWYTPIIQGHVGYVAESLGNFNVEYIIISRRQHLRTGTRLNIRGIDDEGNAGNFCETEQIVKIGDLVYSHVLTRGSVPIFWQQGGTGAQSLYEDVLLTRSTEMTKEPFRMHMQSMVDDY